MKRASKYKESRSTHLVIPADYSFNGWSNFGFNHMRSIIVEAMKKHQMKSVMVMTLQVSRKRLITKERMESHYRNPIQYASFANAWRKQLTSRTGLDDLEFLYEILKCEDKVVCVDGLFQSYFTPRLTKHELNRAELADESYFKNFEYYKSSDNSEEKQHDLYVDKAEWKLSDSNSKYVEARSYRSTIIIDIDEGTPSFFPRKSF